MDNEDGSVTLGCALLGDCVEPIIGEFFLVRSYFSYVPTAGSVVVLVIYSKN